MNIFISRHDIQTSLAIISHNVYNHKLITRHPIDFAEFCSSSHFWEATTAKRMKIDPYHQQQKCRPMTLVSGNIRRKQIFAEVPLGGGVKLQWGCRRRQFLAICVATSSETTEIRPAILHGDMLPLVCL